MVIGEKLYSGNFSGGSTQGGVGGGVNGGGIPKSPSFHSSLELAEATGRQIVSPENCNYFTFNNTTTPSSNTTNKMSDEQNTANHIDKQPSTTNGFVAKTIQNFARFQNNMTNNLQSNNFVDNENNDTNVSSSSIRSSSLGGGSNSITNRINSINDNTNNGPNRLNNTSNNLIKMQQTNNISTCGDNNKSLLKPASLVNGSPSRARDRNILNGGVSPSSTVNGSAGVPLPLIKGS